MSRDSDATPVTHHLQRAGLSIPGCRQLVLGEPLSDPADRAIVARLLAPPASTRFRHPPSLVPPAPPVPLPSMRHPPGLAGVQRPAAGGGGASDSIWIDLDFPAADAARRALVQAGFSRQGIEALRLARPIVAQADRRILADWITRQICRPAGLGG
ncbi:MAG: hypothetical protein KDG55_05230 [Rhodocyclaceae bacterium]|nr:hypothetical protein [Rhodocyclaceae bacterium]